MKHPFIDPPKKIPIFLRFALWVSKKETGKDLLPAKLLAWYPRVAAGSAVFEMLVAKGKNKEQKRLLNLIRLKASFVCSCAFCIDLNAVGIETNGITFDEIRVLQGKKPIGEVNSFSAKELIAIEYAEIMSSTPLHFTEQFVDSLNSMFSNREVVMLASAIAAVNYWARLNQGMGVPSAGFTDITA